MPIQESGEMYLECIYVLSKTKGTVRSIDIVEYNSEFGETCIDSYYIDDRDIPRRNEVIIRR